MEIMLTCGYIPRDSRDHARNVAWVLNPNTDLISAKYQVIFDDMFTTVAVSLDTDTIDLWKDLHKSCKHQDECPVQASIKTCMEEAKENRQGQDKKVNDSTISEEESKEYNRTTKGELSLLTKKMQSLHKIKVP
eukprot:4327641-Ditylum_brightwellii.AAC.1